MSISADRRLSADELAYHQTVLAQVAQMRAAADTLLNTWIGHLSQKYGLNQFDQIEPSGRIVSVPPPPVVLVPQDK